MDQWGVGRKGFDDGLVILFDMYPGNEHGQVILYGGPGFRATFLDNAEKQKIFDEDMLPKLRGGDFDGALLAAMAKVDAAATPEHAATLERGRQVDAVLGLLVAPLLAALIVGRALWSWRRYRQGSRLPRRSVRSSWPARPRPSPPRAVPSSWTGARRGGP